MHIRLSQELHTHNILITEQYAFKEGISTENAAFRLTVCALKSINQKMHVGGIFCDLAKAFDCVNHEVLLAKLQFYGIQGVAEGWFRCYLRKRREKVEVTSPNKTKIFFSA
jgi:hypothetical protein